MNLPLFIARRLWQSSVRESSSSRTMVRIAVISISLSVAIMIIAVGIVGGFSHTIADKISGFAGDYQLTQKSITNPNIRVPFLLDSGLVVGIRSIKGLQKFEGYATTKGLLQTGQGVEGVVLRGVEPSYDWDFIKRHLVAGALPRYTDTLRSREVVISQEIARKMKLDVGDVFKFIVINDNPRRDRFRVAAIYNSGLIEFDSKLLLTHIATVQRLNGWEDRYVEGYQVYTKGDEQVAEQVAGQLPDERWSYDSLRDNYVQFFDWIEMLNVNTRFVLAIMLIVAIINMLCGILVIILESVGMIGVLKTQGMGVGMLQRIFIYRCGYIVLWGLFWGNLLGLGLCGIQYYWGLLTLNAEAYMLSSVPIWLTLSEVVMINLGSFAVITVMMILPTMIVNRINPASSVKYN